MDYSHINVFYYIENHQDDKYLQSKPQINRIHKQGDGLFWQSLNVFHRCSEELAASPHWEDSLAGCFHSLAGRLCLVSGWTPGFILRLLISWKGKRKGRFVISSIKTAGIQNLWQIIIYQSIVYRSEAPCIASLLLTRKGYCCVVLNDCQVQ